MIEKLMKKYALTEQGAKDFIKSTISCTITDLILMIPVGLLYLLVSDLLNGIIPVSHYYIYGIGIVGILVLLYVSNYFQYNATFFSTYIESGKRRILLAERLRKLPLSFFGKRDLSDLTSVLLTDCERIEHNFSHIMPQFYGSIISTCIIAISLFFFDWRMSLAALWVLPIALIIVGTSGKVQNIFTRKKNEAVIDCTEGIQECIETVRDLKANNSEDRYLEGLTKKIKKVEKKNIFAELGPSGGGKTTISKLCARFWDATKGKITLGGIDISKVDPETLLNNYSIVFQDVTLFDNTVMENIRIGKKGATDNEVIKAAKQAKCDEFISKLPDGYNTYIGENGCNLSGGERQRISIARAILKDSPVILLDEATASLDAENETEIQEAISKLVKNKTVLIIAHRMRTVTNADKIVLLKDGVVKEQGNPKELLEKDSIFKDMVQKQQESLEWNLN